jgi:hypothetical protein
MFTPRPFYPPRNSPWYPSSRILGELQGRSGHFGGRNVTLFCRESNTICGMHVLPVASVGRFLVPEALAFVRSPSLFYPLVHSRCRGLLFALDHTQEHTTVGRTLLDEGSARRRDLYLTTQTLYKRQTSMLPVGFEPTIPASARPHSYALESAAAGIG